MGTVKRPGDYAVNLIHYEDAAALTLQVLLGAGSDGGKGYRGEVFLATDGNPVTLQGMMDAYASGGACSSNVEFVGTGGAATSKALDNRKTRRLLGEAWEPKYPSCADFLASGSKDWFTTCGLF
ncbi:unnamed protein product [Ostreobium quekettii]|uniref:Uncharacterized protein n=1 Tax=Ostreobium quekettii TaxID=121088 RepID=A0A8S1J3L7_9CHLO|nr:unnamed protein product [Ostreobium quekettii]